jgi:hypothetical protein
MTRHAAAPVAVWLLALVTVLVAHAGPTPAAAKTYPDVDPDTKPPICPDSCMSCVRLLRSRGANGVTSGRHLHNSPYVVVCTQCNDGLQLSSKHVCGEQDTCEGAHGAGG